MLERDYIKRLIRQFFEAIEKLKEEKEKEDIPTVQLQVNSMYTAYFLKSASFFYEQDTEFAIQYLASSFSPDELLERVEMLSELFYQDALLKATHEARKDLLKKSLSLLTFLDTHSDTFSFERRAKMANLQALIVK